MQIIVLHKTIYIAEMFLSLVMTYTTMRKQTDLIAVQQADTDTLHKKNKPQNVIVIEAGCLQYDVFNNGNLSRS